MHAMGGFAQEMAEFVEILQEGTAPNFDRPYVALTPHLGPICGFRKTGIFVQQKR
jgi:hypothetical protein